MLILHFVLLAISSHYVILYSDSWSIHFRASSSARSCLSILLHSIHSANTYLFNYLSLFCRIAQSSQLNAMSISFPTGLPLLTSSRSVCHATFWWFACLLHPSAHAPTGFCFMLASDCEGNGDCLYREAKQKANSLILLSESTIATANGGRLDLEPPVELKLLKAVCCFSVLSLASRWLCHFRGTNIAAGRGRGCAADIASKRGFQAIRSNGPVEFLMLFSAEEHTRGSKIHLRLLILLRALAISCTIPQLPPNELTSPYTIHILEYTTLSHYPHCSLNH